MKDKHRIDLFSDMKQYSSWHLYRVMKKSDSPNEVFFVRGELRKRGPDLVRKGIWSVLGLGVLIVSAGVCNRGMNRSELDASVYQTQADNYYLEVKEK